MSLFVDVKSLKELSKVLNLPEKIVKSNYKEFIDGFAQKRGGLRGFIMELDISQDIQRAVQR